LLIGILFVVLAWIDYVWLCTADCGGLATAILASVMAPAVGMFLGAAAVIVAGTWVMLLARLFDATRSRLRKPKP
jgi:hypothetical protein